MSGQAHRVVVLEPLEPRWLLSGSDLPDASDLLQAALTSLKTGTDSAVIAPLALTGGLSLTATAADDFGNTMASAGTLRLKSSGSGSLKGAVNYAGDADLLAIVATVTGTIQVDMAKSGSKSRLDTYLYAYDAAGSHLVSNDDFGSGTNSRITFAVTAGQTYYLKAAGYGDSTGAYKITAKTAKARVQPVQTTQPATSATSPATTPAPGTTVSARTVSTSSGLQLLVTGTNGNDLIVLSQSGSTITLTTSAGVQNFTGSFTSVVVYGFAGNDTLRVTHTVTAAGIIYGGAGDDSLFEAGTGRWTLYGEDGDDLLVTIGGGADTLVGGLGLDSFWCDTADVIQDASAAETAATAVHRISQFYQPYTTVTTSSYYVSLTIAGQNLADPTTSYQYRNFATAPLFADGPQYNDVVQGYLGDCYYLASLASLADTDPQLIRQAITSLGDGTFAVRFYRNGQPVYLRLDADLPTNASGGLVYARRSGTGEIWVALMEKAYAYFRTGANSYASIEAGWMANVNRELTNQGSATAWTSATTESAFLSFLQTHLSAGHAVTVGSNSWATGPIVGNHAYMVKSVNASASTVTFYNPWGVDGGSRTDTNPYDGLITLTMADVKQLFAGAVACLA